MRQDGKFIGVGGTIPEGQGILMAHLNECHELVEMVCFTVLPVSLPQLTPDQLKESMEEVDDDDEDIEDDEDYDEEEEADGDLTEEKK